jgi:hypothetical protein
VWGDVTISVQDVPDAPGAPTRTGSYEGGQATLTWSTPQANNSPITGYRLQGTNGVAKDCGTATVCTITGLDPKSSYQFSVVAKNAIGDSAASPNSAPISADFVPAPPTGITVSPSKSTPNQLDVSWNRVGAPNNGTAVDNYVVSIEGPGLSTSKNTGTATSTSFTGAQSAAQYTVTVSARNGADRNGTVVQWNSGTGTGTAVGSPATPRLSANGNRQGSRTAVALSASESDWGGGNPSWRIAKYSAGTPIPSGCSTSGAEYVWTDSTASDTITSQYRYVALADNGLFCTASQPASVEGYQTPDAPTGTVTVDADPGNRQNYVVNLRADGSTSYLYYSVNGGSSVRFSGTTSIGAGAGFGIESSVVFTSCAVDGDYCASSGPSRGTAYTTHASVTSAVAGQPPVVRAPDNNGNSDLAPSYKVEYCTLAGIGCTTQKPDNGGTYSLSDNVPTGYGWIRVTATVNGNDDPNPDTVPITQPDN